MQSYSKRRLKNIYNEKFMHIFLMLLSLGQRIHLYYFIWVNKLLGIPYLVIAQYYAYMILELCWHEHSTWSSFYLSLFCSYYEQEKIVHQRQDFEFLQLWNILRERESGGERERERERERGWRSILHPLWLEKLKGTKIAPKEKETTFHLYESVKSLDSVPSGISLRNSRNGMTRDAITFGEIEEERRAEERREIIQTPKIN